MSQQENENKKKELSSEDLKKRESEKVSEETTSEKKEMSAESVSDQPKDTTENTSDKNSEPAQAEIESSDHEDAMVDESASGKATSDLKAREKEHPEEDPYTELDEAKTRCFTGF